MEELTVTLTDLKTKIEKLVNLHQELKKDNQRLTDEKSDLLKTIEEQTHKIESLQTINNELEQNKSREQKEIITETKLKINELVQEVDNCIALLK